MCSTTWCVRRRDLTRQFLISCSGRTNEAKVFIFQFRTSRGVEGVGGVKRFLKHRYLRNMCVPLPKEEYSKALSLRHRDEISIKKGLTKLETRMEKEKEEF
ncbi:hypothetical protein CDAR_441021 [Caerostris darwini]|uniref:Uncharacterized protein n=1 Tax=Caerostris darwini TaxID=1538125 RepID=A0AAV4QTW7_9ARAC|nr:hypothetical protein CDAR_441021 [Caerostris darwini]